MFARIAIRLLLKYGGGFLTAHGIFTSNQWTAILGPLSALIGVLVSVKHENNPLPPKLAASPKVRQGMGLLCVFGLLGLTASGQQATNPPTTGGFFSQAVTWGTSFNTNSPGFAPLQFWSGPVWASGNATTTASQVADESGLSYDAWRESTNASGGLFLAPEERTRVAPGGSGLLVSQSIGLEFGLNHYDFRLAPFIDGVYVFTPKKLRFEGGLQVSKMLSSVSSLSMAISYQTGGGGVLLMPSFNVTFGNGGGFLGLGL